MPVLLVGNRVPFSSNHRNKGMTGAHPLGQLFSPPAADLHVLDVEKNVTGSEPTPQAVADTSRNPCGILPPIADEDAARHPDVPMRLVKTTAASAAPTSYDGREKDAAESSTSQPRRP